MSILTYSMMKLNFAIATQNVHRSLTGGYICLSPYI